MYNKQLDTFVKVATLKSFSKASEELFITPSAVIQQVNRLENELHVRLLNRTNHGVSLTPTGIHLLKRAPELIQLSNEIKHEIENVHNSLENQVCVGIHLTHSCTLISQYWKTFSKLHPEYQIKIVELVKKSDNIDIFEGVLYDENKIPNHFFLQLEIVPIVCAISPTHPLASKNILTIEDLKQYNFVTVCKGRSDTLDKITENLRKQNVQVTEVEHYNLSLYSNCQIDQSIVQIPLSMKNSIPGMIVKNCEWSYTLPYGLIYKKTSSKATHEFIDYIKNKNDIKLNYELLYD